MSCTINGTRVSKELNNVLDNASKELHGIDLARTKIQLVSFLKSKAFREYYLLNAAINIDKSYINKGYNINPDSNNVSDFEGANFTTLKTELKNYYLNKLEDINAGKKLVVKNQLHGFSDSFTHRIAKEHVGHMIIDIYRNEQDKPANRRKSNMDIISEVNNKIQSTFFNRVRSFIDDIVAENSKYSDEAKRAANTYLNILARLNEHQDSVETLEAKKDEIRAEIASIKNDNNRLRKDGKELQSLLKQAAEEDKESIKSNIDRLRQQIDSNKQQIIELEKGRTGIPDIQRQINDLKDSFDVTNSDKLAYALKLVQDFAKEMNVVSRTALQNYANLVIESKYDANAFYFDTFNTKTMTTLTKEFSKIGDIEEYLAEEELENGEIVTKYDGDVVDETSKTWEDNLYKNTSAAVSTRIKLILSDIPLMTQPYDKNSEFDAIDTNNGLGVARYLDASYVISQIFTNASISNRELFINSLDELSHNVHKLYGLGKIVEMLRQDKQLLNEMFVAFAKPRIKKTILSVTNLASEEGIIFDYSNNRTTPSLQLATNLINRFRYSYYNAYNRLDIATLDTALEIYEANDNINKLNEALIPILSNYLPNIPKDTIDNLKLEVDKTARHKNVRDLISNLKTIIEEAGNGKEYDNEEYSKYYESDQIRKKWNLFRQENLAKGLKEPEVYQQKKWPINDNAKKAIFTISRILNRYNENKVNLNSTNAEGNSSSDIMKNSWITRFAEQILAETDENVNGGLKQLLGYFTQGIGNGRINQYYYNPLLFGLRDYNGVPVRTSNVTGFGNMENIPLVMPGLFKEVSPGNFIVSDEAKSMFDINLFDGTKNVLNNNGKGYAGMNKLDFFITQYFAYKNSTSEITENGYESNIAGRPSQVLPMRIGSDAPKIFFTKSIKLTEEQHIKYALYNHVMNEITIMMKGLDAITTEEQVNGEKTIYRITNNTHNLLDRILHNGPVYKDGKLTGNAFKFDRLFDLNNYKANEQLDSLLSLYGEGGIVKSDEKGLYIDLSETNSPIQFGTSFYVNKSDEFKNSLINIIDNWVANFKLDAKERTNDFIVAAEANGIEINENDMNLYLLNAANMNIVYDDIFEGDFKFYKNSRDSFKRMKESQAGGESYASFNYLEEFDGKLRETKLNNEIEPINVKVVDNIDTYTVPNSFQKIVNNEGKTEFAKTPLIARNGFRAITIYNTEKVIDDAMKMPEILKPLFMKQGIPEKKATEMANKIAEGFLGEHRGEKVYGKTKINDAQSYITLDEFIRRRYADGTLRNYKKIIDQLIDPNISAEQIDLSEINARIQVGKNFYYDKVYDETSGLYYPRQIKNAEFVLIPKLLPEGSELRKLHDFMVKNDIGQINTNETSKAGKKNILEVWNKDTGEMTQSFEELLNTDAGSQNIEDYIETYEYKYLYKQQEVPEHMQDMQNKAGIQIVKKIIDNILNETELESNAPFSETIDPETGEKTIETIGEHRQKLVALANRYQDAYTTNIKESFENFLDNMGWGYDENTNTIYNKDNNLSQLNFDQFYARAREEAARTGMDSNFIEYLIPDESGRPIMPNWMNAVTAKLESIAQSMFNGKITRQTFPGWHAAQITSVGYSDHLNFYPETGIMEVYLPRWSKLIPRGKTAEEDAEIFKQIQKEGLDIQIGYRIPTEGKQSISVIKIMGFVPDALGSTIVVPHSWVTQTGSDFDVDSVYGISWELETYRENGKIKCRKVAYTEDTVNERELYKDYVKRKVSNGVYIDALGREIESKTKEYRDLINKSNNGILNRKEYNVEDNIRNNIFENRQFPDAARNIIKKINSETEIIDNYNKLDRKGNPTKVRDIRQSYPRIAKELKNFLETNKVYSIGKNKETFRELTATEKDLIQQYINSVNKLIDIIKYQDFELYSDAAKALGLKSFEEFEQMPFVERLSRRARNNVILDSMIKIMQDPTSREEQFGRSHFEDITNPEKTGANNVVDKLLGVDNKSHSPYNPLDQLDYFDDAMSGARLKAFSVNWDTFASKNNRVRASVKEDSSVKFVLDLNNNIENSQVQYDGNLIRQSYRDNITDNVSSPVEGQFVKERQYNLVYYSAYSPKFTMSRINQLMPLINEAYSDSEIITIPWKDFFDYYYKYEHNNAGINTTSSREIEFFIKQQFNIDIEYKKGYMQLTKGLYNLLRNTTADEFYAILNGQDALYNENKVKQNIIIDNNYIDSLIAKYNGDNMSHIRNSTSINRYILNNLQNIFGESETLNSNIEINIDNTIFNNSNLLNSGLEGVYEYLIDKYEEFHPAPVEESNTDTNSSVIFNARQPGWSYNNRNVVGRLVTPYAAETTSHHLDAIKEGSIPNVNEYTFPVYKYLSTLGIDYEYIIAFIRQPGISRIVNQYNIANSVFFNSSDDPIQNAIISIISELNQQTGWITYTDYQTKRTETKNDLTSFDVYGYLGYDKKLLQALADKLNIDISEKAIDEEYNNYIAKYKSSDPANIADEKKRNNEIKKIRSNRAVNKVLNGMMIFDKRKLFNRLIAERNHQNDNLNARLFDLACIISFKKLNRIASGIEENINASAADKFGAHPSLKETRQMLDTVDNLRSKDLLTRGGIPYIDLVMPLNENGGIDIEHSLYKSLAASYKYATLMAYRVNKQLFQMENDDPVFNAGPNTEFNSFISAEEFVQNHIGHKFTKAEYKEYKKYAISYLYNQMEQLINPLTLDKQGRIVIKEKAKTTSYWNNEISRIFGFDISDDGGFKVHSKNNPTNAELERFAELTPAQKVAFIQKRFKDDAGIFKYLNVTLYNEWDVRRTGINRHYINYTDNVDSIEDLIFEFGESFKSGNPLIRMAALDLIKYAFVAENFNFKTGYITKIIPNFALYENNANGGLDIIGHLKERFESLPLQLQTEEFVDKFIKSHSYMARQINFLSKSKKSNTAKFRSKINFYTDIVVLDNTKQNENSNGNLVQTNANIDQILINKLGIANSANGYININYLDSNNKTKRTLYKIVGAEPIDTNAEHPIYKKFFLLPLNKLDANETFEVSYNSKNNTEVPQFVLDAVVNQQIQLDKLAFPIGHVQSYKSDSVTPNDEIYLTQMAESGNSVLKGGVNRLLEGIEEFNDQDDLTRDVYIQFNPNSQLCKLVPKGKSFGTQIIHGEKFNIHHASIEELKQIKKSYLRTNNLPDRYTKAILDAKMANVDIAKEVFADKYKGADLWVITKEKPTNAENNTAVLNATSDLLEDREQEQIVMPRTKIQPIDEISRLMMDEINFKALRNKDYRFAVQFKREMKRADINRNLVSDLEDNRQNIYVSAARYYQSAANYIINKLNECEVGGAFYSIDDVNLYEALKEHDEDYEKVALLLLDAKTFGDKIKDILTLDASAEDEETKNAIESIINSINTIKRDNRVRKGFENIFNIYFKKFSTNNAIVNDLVQLRETFGDTDVIDKLFCDSMEINNSEVQVVLKKVYGILSKAQLFTAKERIENFQQAVKDIEEQYGPIDITKFIDSEHGRFYSEYNDRLFEDKKTLNDAYDRAYAEKDIDLEHYKQYIIAKYNRDKFNFDHFNQAIVDDYYERDLANRKMVMDIAGDNFFEWSQLTGKLYAMAEDSELSEDQLREKERIKNRIARLKSEYTGTGEQKEITELNKAIAINKYIKERQDINKEFFDKQEYDGFRETYNRYNKIVTDYNTKHPTDTLPEKLNNPKYREAFNWLRVNGRYTYKEETANKLAAYYKILMNRTNPMNAAVKRILNESEGIKDEAGDINPLALTDDQIQDIKKIEQIDLANMYEDGLGEAILIKARTSPKTKFINTKNADNAAYLSERRPEDVTKQYEISGKINEILKKVINIGTGEIEFNRLIDERIVSRDELRELGNLYAELRDLIPPVFKYYKGAEFKNTKEVLDSSWTRYLTMYQNLTDNNLKDLLAPILFEVRPWDDVLQGNNLLFGYTEIKDGYEDVAKTEAINFLKDNFNTIPSTYYYKAMQQATNEGRYEEWYKANHVYNPYTHKYQPLSIWTIKEVIPGSELAENVEYVASGKNQQSSIKEHKKNDSYNRYYSNYKRGSGYDSGIVLTEGERKMKELYQQTLMDLAQSHRDKKFVGRGYLPRDRKTIIDARYIGNQALNFVGANWHSNSDSEKFGEVRNYIKDKEISNRMLSFLKGKGWQEYQTIPQRRNGEDKETYEARIKPIREANKKIAEANMAIDNAQLNTNWQQVMADYIQNATVFESKEKVKPYLYLLLEDLEENEAYILKGYWNRKVLKKGKNSDVASPITEWQSNSIEMLRNLSRRIIFDQYHENNGLRVMANFLQNMASAKYMVTNLYGGIANLTTGMVNIDMERAAGEYFDKSTLANATKEFVTASFDHIASLYSDKASTETVAFIKHFDVVDFDQVLNFGSGDEEIATNVRRVRNALYAFQSGGEYIMQNITMLAMLNSNRIYTDNNGALRIGDFNEYSQDVERQAMENVIANNESLKIQYDIYKNTVLNNINSKYDLLSGRRDFNREFLRTLKNDNRVYREIAEKYFAERKKLLAEAKIKFNEGKTVKELYTFENGEVHLKAEEIENFNNANGVANVGDLQSLLSEFREKVIAVNKKIHGVYDKKGAALIESKFWGSLVMQYHKHLPTGIMKRWRRRGYYSEFRGSRERGTHQDLMDFLATEFIDYYNNNENQTNIAMKSIQTLIMGTLNTVTNIRFNWKSLSERERNNIRRNLGDLSGVMAAVLIAMALYGLTDDDDDIKDDNMLASILYLADRLYADSTMYTPFGLVSEAKTAWSSPIASGNGPSDLIKGSQLIVQALFNSDFEPTYKNGLYAGKNKFEVLFRRNVPGVRPYDRIMNITRNNNYYKIDNSHIGINLAKMLFSD